MPERQIAEKLKTSDYHTAQDWRNLRKKGKEKILRFILKQLIITVMIIKEQMNFEKRKLTKLLINYRKVKVKESKSKIEKEKHL